MVAVVEYPEPNRPRSPRHPAVRRVGSRPPGRGRMRRATRRVKRSPCPACQVKLIVGHVDLGDPEADGLVGRFTAFPLTVTNMDTTLNNSEDHAIEWLGPPECQVWRGVLSHFKN